MVQSRSASASWVHDNNTVHCDLRTSARNSASSSLQTSSGHGTVQYATCFALLLFLPFFPLSFRLFSALPHCFWLADPTRNIEKKNTRCGLTCALNVVMTSVVSARHEQLYVCCSLCRHSTLQGKCNVALGITQANTWDYMYMTL